MIKKILNFLVSIFNLIRVNKFENKFINHNNLLFDTPNNKDSTILVEMIGSQANHIALSYLLGILSKIHDAKIVGYNVRLPISIFKKLTLKVTNYKKKKIFESYGMTEILDFNINKDTKKLANKLTSKLISQIKSKSDLDSLTIENIWVGDLIYDQYLKSNMLPTINLKSKEFRKLIYEFSFLFIYWRKKLLKKDIKALVISHACYFIGLPGRIATELEIPVYQASLENIYYLTKNKLHPSSEFHTYKEDFERLDDETKLNATKIARERLKLIFKGSVDVDQRYIKHSAYNKNKSNDKLLDNKSSIKILIAPHCFFDSPHGLGKTLFPDFYEWLDFIAKLTSITDYEWYIKTHPKTFPENKAVIKDFVNRYPKIKYLNDEISHNQLIEEGINIVLTVYGSIGLEYAARNITVVNASINNPHISFDFNIHPKSKEDLRKIILSLEKHVNASLSSDDVYKCYYMKYLHYKKDIFIADYKSVIDSMGGYYNSLFTPKIYDFWIKYWSRDIHSHINNSLKEFVLSGEYKMKSNWN